eukprot:1254000-Rhodomonas_salina.2
MHVVDDHDEDPHAGDDACCPQPRMTHLWARRRRSREAELEEELRKEREEKEALVQHVAELEGHVQAEGAERQRMAAVLDSRTK